jgi:LasA protease
MIRKYAWRLGLTLLLAACARPWTETSIITPASIWVSGQVPSAEPVIVTATISYTLPTPRPPGAPIFTPTPDPAHYQDGLARGPETYIVQYGDSLNAIAWRYSLDPQLIIQANDIQNPDALEVGQSLVIPMGTPQPPGPAYKLVPDSELVYGPGSAAFDIAAFIHSQGGYLANYTQDVNGEILDAAQVVQRIAEGYSINPRLLLAVLEARSGWVTNPNPDPALDDNPFGYIDDFYVGLYRQLAWVSIQLNSGFYRWRANSVTSWILSDNSVVPIDPTINAGTAGVQNLFARLDDYSTWLRDVSPGGVFDTYYLFFGYPFDTAIEPLVPTNLTQPAWLLPFRSGEIWYFTSGPHLAWDAGSPYSALDFAPPVEGCVQVDNWITAIADGLVTRTGTGLVIQDLDGDGNEGSGWVIIYLHIESRDRVQPGQYLRAGEPLGHPSCEGGISSGTHVHIARKFNGVWIPADGPVPFDLSGWVASGTGEEAVGTLTRKGLVSVSHDGMDTDNQIQR